MPIERFPFLAQRMFNVPLAISEAKANAVIAALGDRLGLTQPEGARPAAFLFDDDEDDAPPPRRATGYDVVQGVAVIEVSGILVQKSGYLRPLSGMTGYDGLRTNFAMALADEDVQSIAFLIDSPGGEVAGLFDLVDSIYAARGQKPIRAILDESAYSAAYAIASATDHISVPRTGGAGSVGVITMLVDYSRAVRAAGLTVHFVHYGERKAEESRASYQGVTPELLNRIQADVDAMGALFTETVARNRGLSRTIVRNWEADTFLGEQGVRNRLADALAAPDAAFLALLADLDAA